MEYAVVAYNRSEDHPNRVHDSEFARSVGFKGGLVPGVDVFGYMAHPLVERWGIRWLGQGRLDARFNRPVYDGDRLQVSAQVSAEDGEASVEVTLANAEGEVCASARADRESGEAPPDPDRWPVCPLPEPAPEATPEALAVPALGSLELVYDDAECRQALADLRETLAVFTEQRIVHPGHLLRVADAILAANVQLPPWMHVSSRAAFFAPARWGDRVEVRANVLGEFEKKGHRFVQLDVLALRDGQPLMRVNPYTAIYRPAFVV